MKVPRWTPRNSMVLIASLAGLMKIGSFEVGSHGANCGGNAAALHDLHTYWCIARMGAAESPGRQFVIDAITAEQRGLLSQIASDSWIRPARFLVSRAPFRDQQSGPASVLIVCDTPFQNMPKRLLWPAPPRYAAAFSDGTIRLISTAEFRTLDLSLLVPLDEVLATPNP